MIAIVVQNIRIAPDKKENRTFQFVGCSQVSKFITPLYVKLAQRELNDVGAALACKESPAPLASWAFVNRTRFSPRLLPPFDFLPYAHTNFSSAGGRCPSASPRLPESNFTEANARVDSGSVIIAQENVPKSQSRLN